MKKDSQILIDQIQQEWDEIAIPFKNAEEKYNNQLKELILKYVSSPVTFDADYETAWEITGEDHQNNFSARDLIERTHVLHTMLNEYFLALEYSED
jgi:hypothetical protein